jgi:hypothetical protein
VSHRTVPGHVTAPVGPGSASGCGGVGECEMQASDLAQVFFCRPDTGNRDSNDSNRWGAVLRRMKRRLEGIDDAAPQVACPTHRHSHGAGQSITSWRSRRRTWR